ncbi:MAG TPA: DUF4440 domain-containing protein [Steroidobacteraceae bacterium]|jgi:uncharacterized protein (TIGR02246 family)
MTMRSSGAGLALLAALAACQGGADPGHAEAEIRAADAHWLAAARAHDLERTLSYWSDDVILMQPGSAPLVGKDALRKYVKESFAIPDFSISWVIDRVWIAKSGDLAYATGTDEISLTTPDGKHVVEHNDSVGIWRRGPDGAWKCAVDIWNSAGPQS